MEFRGFSIDCQKIMVLRSSDVIYTFITILLQTIFWLPEKVQEDNSIFANEKYDISENE